MAQKKKKKKKKKKDLVCAGWATELGAYPKEMRLIIFCLTIATCTWHYHFITESDFPKKKKKNKNYISNSLKSLLKF